MDADHKYESVKYDILSWLPKLKAGCKLAGDDIHLTSVCKAVDDLLGLKHCQIFGNTWIYQKPILAGPNPPVTYE